MKHFREAPDRWSEFERSYHFWVLGEDDCGQLWLPSWCWRKDAWQGDERRWGRRFNLWNSLHWPRYLNTIRLRTLSFLESY